MADEQDPTQAPADPSAPAPADPAPADPTPVTPDPAPVDPVPAEPEVDVVAILEDMAEKITKLKSAEEALLAQNQALKGQVVALTKQLSDAGVTPADPTIKFYSQAELDAQLAAKDAEVQGKVDTAVSGARAEEQQAAATKLQSVKDAAKALIAKVKDADDDAAAQAQLDIDAL